MSIAILKTELTTDPLARGYAGMSDEEAASSLNTVIDRVLNKTSMSGSEVYNAIVESEYDLLTDPQKQEVWDILHLGDINPFGLEATRFMTIFGGGSATITALASLRKTDVSRGVELGLGHVRPGNVTEARI